MTHSTLSVVSCPTLTCRPCASHCQRSLRTSWPSSLRLKCASEDRARDPRRLCNSLWRSWHRIPAPPIRQSDGSLTRGRGHEPHHNISPSVLKPAHCFLSSRSDAAGRHLAQTEAEDV